MISLIMTAYNRAPQLPRAIKSVLAQDYQDWEIIVVDDGSSDDTQEVLKQFTDPRIRVVRHPVNRGVNAAKNTGMNNIRGEWFTFLDSDDELATPDALSTLANVPARVDPSIDAISCNCIDSVTGQFSGFGVEGDQYLDWKTILLRCTGEHWGITKTSLLGDARFDEKMRGFEDVLWMKINKKARRYYIHKALRIWHTEGDDRLCKERVDNTGKKEKIYESYVSLMNEKEFLEDYRAFNKGQYRDILYSAGLSFVENRDLKRGWGIVARLTQSGRGLDKSAIIASGLLFGPRFLLLLKRLRNN